MSAESVVFDDTNDKAQNFKGIRRGIQSHAGLQNQNF